MRFIHCIFGQKNQNSIIIPLNITCSRHDISRNIACVGLNNNHSITRTYFQDLCHLRHPPVANKFAEIVQTAHYAVPVV
jgi:hypothetical protein